MGDHNKQFCLGVLIIGVFFSCSWEKTEPDERSQPSPDTTQTTDFYFFIPAAAFLDSGYDVLALFEERDDIPVLPVGASYEIFKSKAALFIDAREPEEYASGHIPGAVNIPYDLMTLPEYKNIISRLDKKRRIVVYCNTHQCIVSYSCAEGLMYLGFNRVVIAEGYMHWVGKGYPIEKSVP